MRVGAFLLVAGWGASPSTAQPPAVAGTMPEDALPGLQAILRAAWTQSPQAIEKQFEVAQAEAGIIIADAGRLPHVGGSLDYATNQTATKSDTSTRTRDTGLFYSFQLSQSIFRWNELKNRSAAARVSALVAERSFGEVYRSLAVTLRASYLDLVVKKAALKQARFARELAQKDYEVENDRFKHGTVSEETSPPQCSQARRGEVACWHGS